jgi:hypothetical protein
MEVLTLRDRPRSPFVYTRLDPSRPCIRLLYVHQLRRDAPDRPPECSLFHVLLNDNPRYLALSYTWGSDADTSMINVNGRALEINSNLANFLKTSAAQWSETDRGQLPYWIDAISINQHDIAERSQQVAIMGRIYQKALATISYLADYEIPRPIFKSLRLIEEFCQSIESYDYYDGLDHYWSHILSLWLYIPQALRVALIESICAICHASYWSRMWIVQEVILAKAWHIVTRRGEHISGRALYAVVHYLMQLDANFKIQPYSDAHQVSTWPAYGVIRYAAGASRPYGSSWMGPKNSRGYQTSWQILLETYQRHECRDLHDKIYGILALVDGGDDFPVDYRQSLPQLLMEVMRFREDFSRAMNKFHVPPFEIAHTVMSTLHLDTTTVLSDIMSRPVQVQESIIYEAKRIGAMSLDVKSVQVYSTRVSLMKQTASGSWKVPVRIYQCPCCAFELDNTALYTAVRIDGRGHMLILEHEPMKSDSARLVAVGECRPIPVHWTEDKTEILDGFCQVCAAIDDPKFVPKVSDFVDLCAAPAWFRGTMFRGRSDEEDTWRFELTTHQFAHALSSEEVPITSRNHYNVGKWPLFHHCRPQGLVALPGAFFEHDELGGRLSGLTGCYWGDVPLCHCTTDEAGKREKTDSNSRRVIPKNHKARFNHVTMVD